MARTNQQIHIKNKLLTASTALGNTSRGLKEVCSDLLNDFAKDKKQVQAICDGTFLSRITVERMMRLDSAKSGEPYRPQAESCERILRFFGASILFDQVIITPKYSNKSKEELD